MESAAWDNVTVRKMGGSGEAVSVGVNLPVDTYWKGLNVGYKREPGTTITISLVDPATGYPYPGLTDITTTYVDLEEKLDPAVASAIALKVEMVAVGMTAPSVGSWKVTWEGDPPFFIKPFPEVTMNEDEDRERVIDLRRHFEDRFTEGENLTYTVAWTSESQNVMPVIDGYWLGFQLPRKDFYGTEYYKIRCSDGTLSVDSIQGTVVVNPVDDPPMVRPFGRVDMYEDEEYELNMTPHLEDVDSPVNVLRVRAKSDNARVEGQLIYLYYDLGGDHQIELVISDYSNDVVYMLDVRVREVDDPPIFSELDRVAVFEDVERTVDLAEYIYDEDDSLEELLIDIEDADRYISLNGTNVTLFYNDTGGEFEYTILVSDERTTVSQTLVVSVREVNDPPRVVSVAGMVPVKDQVFWNMTEGNTSDLPIVVEDEESKTFQYTLVSDMDGARMVGASLRLETEEGEVGTYRLQISISDGGAATLVKVEVDVTNRNDPVQDVAITEPTNETRIELGTLITLKGYAFDPDFAFNQRLNYTWSSDLDGTLGHGKNLKDVNLTKGDHVITLVVTDGEFSDQANATVTVFQKGGGGGGGGGGDNGDGIGESGRSILMILGIVVALVIVGVLVFAARRGVLGGSEQVTFSEPPPQAEEDMPSAAEAFDKPPERPEDVKVKPKKELTEAAGEAEAPAAVEAPKQKYEAVAVDTAMLAESDPEQRRLDDKKRKYQAAISALPFGVPSSELATMDWYELAKAMAEGEHKTLDDGKTVVKIGESWYYADPDDAENFLRRHA
jgi:hypothetical protein